MKKDFKQQVQTVRNDKNEQSLYIENKNLHHSLNQHKKEIDYLRDMIKQVQANKETFLLNISDIKLIRNKRNNYEFEDIEELAEDILKNGQIQAVTLTKDNYLLAGHRRYFAIKYLKEQKKHDGDIISINLDSSYKEIGIETFDKLQLAENEQRKGLDNFHLSDLFQQYIKDGKTQKEISEIFDKSKSKVSELLSIQKIQTPIFVKLREIQHYGMTLKKFLAKNLSSKDRQSSIIGVTPLYKISSAPEKDQVKIFIELFGSKIHKDDLKDLNYTKFVRTKETYIDSVKRKLDKDFSKFEKKYTDNTSKKIIDKAKEYKDLMEKELRKLEL